MDNWNEMMEIIDRYNMDAETLLRLLTDYHGSSVISNDFMENLRECEGYEYGN